MWSPHVGPGSQSCRSLGRQHCCRFRRGDLNGPNLLEHLSSALPHQHHAELLSIVLVGLPELADRLQLRKNRAFWSRIYIRLSLGEALPEDTAEYLADRLEKAGCKREVFSENAAALIHEAALGRLRDIDRLATAALNSASRRKNKIVDRKVITDVIERQSMNPNQL